MKLFVLAGIKSISNLFDGSFFVPYLISVILKKIIKWPTRCTACLYGMLSRIILRFWVATALLPESECKGKANFGTDKQILSFFSKKTHLFLNLFCLMLIIRVLRGWFFFTLNKQKSRCILRAGKYSCKHLRQPRYFFTRKADLLFKNSPLPSFILAII